MHIEPKKDMKKRNWYDANYFMPKLMHNPLLLVKTSVRSIRNSANLSCQSNVHRMVLTGLNFVFSIELYQNCTREYF